MQRAYLFMDFPEQSEAMGPSTHVRNWPGLASALAEKLPVEVLHPLASAELRKLAQDRNDENIIGIACSGGADSLCLLLLLYVHFPELRNKFVVLHFDHCIRGVESTLDAEFVCEVSASLGIRCLSDTWAAGTPNASEECARNARMAFLHEKANVITFGHNQTDVAETILIRIGRGSSLDGLAGPRPVQRFRKTPGMLHLRPLLNLSGAEIRENLSACGIPWREDSTNSGLKYTRNKLRHKVLPLLEAVMDRNWASGAARSRARIEEADDALDHDADEVLKATHEDRSALHVSALSNTNPALARRTLERWLENNDMRGNFPAQAMDRILESATRGSFPKNLNITGLRISTEFISDISADAINPDAQDWPEIEVAQNCEVFFPNRTSLKVEEIELSQSEIAQTIDELRRKGSLTDIILSINRESTLTIRRRKEGDAYKALGAPGRNKLHDMQINRKIPASERHLLPVVLEETHIVWSPLLPPADEKKLTAASNHAVRLTYCNISTASDSYKRNAD